MMNLLKWYSKVQILISLKKSLNKVNSIKVYSYKYLLDDKALSNEAIILISLKLKCLSHHIQAFHHLPHLTQIPEFRDFQF